MRRRRGCCSCLAVVAAPAAAAVAVAAEAGQTDLSRHFVVAAEVVRRGLSLRSAVVVGAGRTSSIPSSAAVAAAVSSQTGYWCCSVEGRLMSRRGWTVSCSTAAAVAAAIDRKDRQLVLWCFQTECPSSFLRLPGFQS